MRNYQMYTAEHLSDRVRDGMIVIIKKPIKHHKLDKYSE